MDSMHRRSVLALASALGASAVLPRTRAVAAGEPIVVGVDVSLTGADAEVAKIMQAGVILAAEDINAKGGVAGRNIKLLMLDDGTTTAGQYDPAQAATNARRMVADPAVVAAIGPMSSGAGKAMAPILSQGDLATVTPSSTNPDLTDPKFAAQYRPAGKNIYFRTVTTDAYQGPNLANFFAERLKLPSVFVLDDSGAYGVGLADAFQGQAARKGIKVLGRDRLDPKSADYSAIITKIKSLGAASLYFGGDAQAGVKVVKQSFEIVPSIVKAGGDGMYGADILKGGGFPAVEGWYATLASPHVPPAAGAADWFKRFRARFGTSPSDYSITSYDALLVIAAAIDAVAKAGNPIDRHHVRAAIQDVHVETVQGAMAFDANGDLLDKTVSVFQAHDDPHYPPDDVEHQFVYIGPAPAETA